MRLIDKIYMFNIRACSMQIKKSPWKQSNSVHYISNNFKQWLLTLQVLNTIEPAVL